MDRAEPRQALDGAEAPQSPMPRRSEQPAVDHDGQPALPPPQPLALEQPEQPERPRGRHEATGRRALGGPAGVAIAVVVASAEEAPDPVPAGDAAATRAQGGPSSRPLGPGSFGNLVVNWSFEQDLNGWQVLGEADGSREPQGRTSGSCASVRARGPEPGRVGLALPEVVPTAGKGQRYVASAWVRSSAAGQQVTVRLAGGGGKEVSRATATTLPGLAWKRVIVDHTVATAGPLRLEIVADGVLAGDALLVDEVVVRQG